jgi:hypothetical protein
MWRFCRSKHPERLSHVRTSRYDSPWDQLSWKVFVSVTLGQFWNYTPSYGQLAVFLFVFVALVQYCSRRVRQWTRRESISLKYEGVSKSFRTGRLERELQMVQLSATRYCCIDILWASLVSFTAITLLCRFSTSVYRCLYRYDSVRKFLDTPSSINEIIKNVRRVKVKKENEGITKGKQDSVRKYYSEYK